MRRPVPLVFVRRRSVVAFGALALGLVLAVGIRSSADAVTAPGQLSAEPVLKSTAAGVTRLFGASPGEAAGEVWGSAFEKGLARYTDATGWQKMPTPVDGEGQPIADLNLPFGALAGRTTPAGGVLVTATGNGQKLLLARDPGGVFQALPAPDPTLMLSAARLVEYDAQPTPEEKEAFFAANGEELFGESPATLLAAPVDAAGGKTGAYVVPSPRVGALDGILRFDGGAWTREQLCVDAGCTKAPSLNFRVLAIDASGPGNPWLLTRGAVAGDGIELFTRETGGVWKQRPLGGALGALFGKSTPLVGVTVAARGNGQALTVTDAGVWVDSTIKVKTESFDATFYYAGGQVQQSWCDAPEAGAALCGAPLGSELPASQGRSFAWPTGGAGFGQRAITGVGQGAMLILTGSSFERVPLVGGQTGADFGAALSAPDQGWLGNPGGPLRLTRQPAPSALQPWPVPFRRPLTAIAPEPGAPVGGLSSEALAVGDEGQVARYLPGQGWATEPLLTSSGVRARPRLRAVAWPEPGFAYAVGDDGAMWVWRGSAGLWEQDAGAPPNLVRGNFTGIAFDPSEPARGFAVGKQGLLLSLAEKQWTQDPLPAGLNPEANFTGIAFAGHQALASYKVPLQASGAYSGGLLANDGSGWRLEPGIPGTPMLVAGLPDGGAAAVVQKGPVGQDAEEFLVAERQAPGAAWTLAPEPIGGFPAALGIFREGGQVAVAVSVVSDATALGWSSDSEQVFAQPAPGQAPLLTPPYPLAPRGFLVRQVPGGWRDEQHGAYPPPPNSNPSDLPLEPDPVLAMALAPDGSRGWVVGGETGERVRAQPQTVQTAAVWRYGADAAPPVNFTTKTIPGEPGVATFAVGGNAQCASLCADQAGTGIGPEVWLPAATRRAAGIAGVRGFLYTGKGVAEGVGGSSAFGRFAFAREQAAYAERLGSSPLPIFAAPAQSDLDRANSLTTFASVVGGVSPVAGAELARGYYALDSNGAGGPVRVLVLDYSDPSRRLDTARNGNAQSCWLAQQLEAAKLAGRPAIVVGNRDLGNRVGSTQDRAADASEVAQILVTGTNPKLKSAGCANPNPAAASAYFFDFPEENRSYRLISGARSIPAFGAGTLGYVTPRAQTDVAGASGFLLASIDVAERDAATNVAPVSVRLIPSLGELALESADGTLLRRSQPALFRGLARRPQAGGACFGQNAPECEVLLPDPYLKIPSRCQGPNCATGIFPEYSFSSSKPDIADFVKVDPGSANPRAVLLGGNDKPIADPTSGLLCAFNAGTTVVTISAGGLSYSTPVTVQKGSVNRPCGTTPLREKAAIDPPAPPPPIPQEPQPEFEQPPTLPPPPVPVSTPTPAPAPAPNPPPLPLSAAFLPPPAPVLTPVPVIVPPPPPPTAQTTPPSGTSPVTQPVPAPEPEEEEEAAFDLVHHMAAAQHPARPPAVLAGQHSSGSGVFLRVVPAIAVLMALAAAASLKPRRRRPRVRYAYIDSDRPPRRH
ncbi:MAG TPA: hypothetical protein VF081_12320 [Solirubrobacterales bacterium]